MEPVLYVLRLIRYLFIHGGYLCQGLFSDPVIEDTDIIEST